MMDAQKKKKIILMDINSTVYHELGHYIAAIKLGVPTLGCRFHLTGEEDFIKNRSVVGSARIMRTNKENDCIIGLAGEICEYMRSLELDDGNFDMLDEREVFDRINYSIQDETISESDLTLIDDFTMDDVVKVIDILKEQWDQITIEANIEIKDLKNKFVSQVN